ncbi:hypothetical protein JLK41_16610 [Ectopseudomonas khazarica]|uniref:hypothetical protein n=1 Tax=Ectopseudomonas khazarica TaxID=2502979 RepID=UPI001AEFBDAA|nr:hypothetical protein [Pseudomonas khazarica]QTS84937.1 hypothetical protein JLK41_16610 [Pseudomonas khazarica]
MSASNVILSVLSLLVSISSFADPIERKKYNWPQEPRSVIGIKLGVPAADSKLPACIEPSASNGYALPKATCLYSDDSLGVQRIDGLPWKTLRITGNVFLFEGKVKSIHFDIHHGDFPEFSQMLIERYGKPMKIIGGAVQTYGGAELPAKTMEWHGEKTLITAYERYNKIDRSLIVFSDAGMLNKSIELDKKNIESGASSF